MVKAISFTSEVEDLVRFVEDTEPNEIVEATLTKLQDGVSAKELVRAGAVAVVRSTELPSKHHGGPVHPICGTHGSYETSRRLSGKTALVPIIQHVALCNHHIHSRHMGPYIMPELEPMDGTMEKPYEDYFDAESSIVHMRIMGNGNGSGDKVKLTKEAFTRSVQAGRPAAAEQYFLWLLENLPHGEVFDLMVYTAVSRNWMDDHNFLYPMFTVRALDTIGWEWASVLLRPVARYQARNPVPLSDARDVDFSFIEEIVDKYRLLEIGIPTETNEGETRAIGELGSLIGASQDFYETVEMLGKALADGLSLKGAGEALSIGASTVFLSSNYGNPMDSHLHTGTNSRRYLLNMEGISLRNKILALLTGITGPECTLSEEWLHWSPGADTETLAELPERGQEELIDVITETIEKQPRIYWTTLDTEEMAAKPKVKDIISLAQQYAKLGYDPMPLFVRFGELICRDDFTELHAVKQHQAIYEEFNNTREPFRWVHLAAAAKSAAVVHVGEERRVYREVLKLVNV